MRTLVIAARFCGPPASANGGYFAGMVAALAPRSVTVRLLKPPPLAHSRCASRTAPTARCSVLDGAQAIGAAHPARWRCSRRAGPSTWRRSRHRAAMRASAITASRAASCAARSGCAATACASSPAPSRSSASSRRPWVPDASLDRGDGKVQPQFMSAALDCPGYYAVALADQMMLLAEFTAHLDRLVHVGEPCTVIGWRIGASGRKHEAGTALFDGKGELCGRARALWIEPREAVG